MNNGQKEFSLIFSVQFLVVAFIVFYNTCGFNLTHNFISDNSVALNSSIYSLFFMCMGYANYLWLERSRNLHFSIITHGLVFYLIFIIFRADYIFVFATTYTIICAFCLFSNIQFLSALMAFTFGMAGIASNNLALFGFLLVYIGMSFAKFRKSIHYIPMGNYIIPIFTVVLLDNLFRRYVVYSPNSALSISTIGVSVLIFLIITCVPVYSQGRKIDVINISSTLSFFLYKYEIRLLDGVISPALNAFVVLFVNTLVAWSVYVVVRRCVEKCHLKVLNNTGG
ncbi:MAG: hypothetical protein E7270_00380 [Lachnospiraceae bacterium]|nr:hypothetical protein [Lachnospiraceae bacterium]